MSVQHEEALNIEKVKAYLQQHLHVKNEDHFEVRQFSAGTSNLTYLLVMDEMEAVLRRPPLGKLPPKAHDMEREFRLLSKVYPHFPLVPKPYLFCEDKSVIGAPFYVMERKTGIVLNNELPEDLKRKPEYCQQISEAFVDTLVDLHAIDYKACGLEDFGYPDGFLQRQLKNWHGRYEQYKTDDIKEVDFIVDWLEKHLPTSAYVSLIHNDYKLNNVLISEDYKQVTGVFDWEMATVADPLFDLGTTLSYWVEANDSPFMKTLLPTVTFHDGFYTREEIIERYAQKSSIPLNNIHYYVIFAYFKLIGVLQQFYFRYKNGYTNNEKFANLNKRIQTLAEITNEKIVQKTF